MIANLEPQAWLVIDYQRCFCIDFSDVNTFCVLLGDVHKAGLEQFDQPRPQIAKNK